MKWEPEAELRTSSVSRISLLDQLNLESQKPLHVRVHLKRGGASVRTSKILRLARLEADGPAFLKNNNSSNNSYSYSLSYYGIINIVIYTLL